MRISDWSSDVCSSDLTVNQIALDASGATPTGRMVRTLKLGTQSEGCAVDDRTGILYVAEEDVGLWRFDARATGSTGATKIAAADGGNLVMDAEGVAIAPRSEEHTSELQSLMRSAS